MKKFLKFCATFTLVGALFVGCIDNSEPAGIKALREARAELTRAEAALTTAHILFVTARANHENALANLANRQADLAAQAVEAAKIQNDFNRGVLQAQIAAEIAKLNKQAALELELMHKARLAAAIAEEAYIKQLIQMQQELAKAKNVALNQVLTDIQTLLLRKANVEDQRLQWLASKHFYENVDVPFVRRQLEHELEIAQLNHAYAKYLYDVAVEVKDLAINEYTKYASQLTPTITEMGKREVALRVKIREEEGKLEILEGVVRDAKQAYEFSGVNTGLTNISISNVFSKTVTDMFLQTTLDLGFTTNAGQPKREPILSGVFNNTYSFYHPATTEPAGLLFYPEGFKANLGYKNTLDLLKADYNLIKDGRIYGLEGQYMTNQNLAARKTAMDAAIKQYEDACKVWRDSYEHVKNGPDWAAERTAFVNARTAHNNKIGLTNTAAPGTTSYNRTGLDPISLVSNPVG
ncbi:MAG: hypothetical protein FWE30_08860, partial [Bacteroidales bacterium]|nr:hypothetical protein [Bacteroidales bacterium]